MLLRRDEEKVNVCGLKSVRGEFIHGRWESEDVNRRMFIGAAEVNHCHETMDEL